MAAPAYDEQELTHSVIASAMAIHRGLGPGLLESAYSRCLEYELGRRGLEVQREVPISVQYEELVLDYAFRADIAVGLLLNFSQPLLRDGIRRLVRKPRRNDTDEVPSPPAPGLHRPP